MKKLLLLTILGLFFACQKSDEEKTFCYSCSAVQGITLFGEFQPRQTVPIDKKWCDVTELEMHEIIQDSKDKCKTSHFYYECKKD